LSSEGHGDESDEAPWPVLVVDDDGGVLEVTRMALERVVVDGRKLAVVTARSAREARERLAERDFAVAIVDVVMETEHAGLDLVREMRADERHRLTQIVVRSGEPGAYPEAKVIEEFRISDYWPKAELRAARMRASVIGLVRGYATARDLDRELRAKRALVGEKDALIQEREALLREIHHRVKNNLQVVSSLLTLQGQHLDEATRARLDQTVWRVRSMALVHQQLYGHESLSSIDFQRYLEVLTSELASGVADGAVITCVAAPAVLGIEQAIPAGLLATELITNAIKHGRSPDGVARVHVGLTADAGRLTLTIADEGPGLTQLPRPSPGRLGWGLVPALTRQLRGKLQLEGGPGGRVRIDFPLAP
jgi:two-component sensor histidine kinase